MCDGELRDMAAKTVAVLVCRAEMNARQNARFDHLVGQLSKARVGTIALGRTGTAVR